MKYTWKCEHCGHDGWLYEQITVRNTGGSFLHKFVHGEYKTLFRRKCGKCLQPIRPIDESMVLDKE